MGSSLFALQQLSGINAVFYFSSTVFKSAGVPSESANICVGIANLLGILHQISNSCIMECFFNCAVYTSSGSIFALISMDKLGRKALLIASFSGMVKKKIFGLLFNVWCMLAAYISKFLI